MICLGGGSPMDAGKFIRAVYEHPDITLEDAATRFIELRKRTYTFPNVGTKIDKLICIPKKKQVVQVVNVHHLQ